jgi:hypothetical protein
VKRFAKYLIMALVFTVGMLVTTGCGQASGGVQGFAVNDEVRAVALTMFTEKELDGVTFGLGHVYGVDGAIGLCETDAKRVSIEASQWKGMSTLQREMIVAHEVGHCAYGREHDTAMDRYAPKACPNTIMYPANILQTCWYVYRADYLRDLRGTSELPSATPEASTTLPNDGVTRTELSKVGCGLALGNGRNASFQVRTYSDGTIVGHAEVSDGDTGMIQPWDGKGSVTFFYERTLYTFTGGTTVELSDGDTTQSLPCGSN